MLRWLTEPLCFTQRWGWKLLINRGNIVAIKEQGATVFHGECAAPHFVPCEPANPQRNFTAKALESSLGENNA